MTEKMQDKLIDVDALQERAKADQQQIQAISDLFIKKFVPDNFTTLYS